MKLICITGADGTGKSTLVRKIARKISSVYVAGIWDLLKNPVAGLPFKSKQEVDNFLCELTPDSRFLFMTHALKFATDKALKSDKDVILLNAYIYKYFASEKSLQADNQLIKSLSNHFPEPDIIFNLKLKPEISAERKNQFSRYECALSKNPNKPDFIKFQYQIHKNWDFFGHQNIYDLDAHLSPEKLLQNVLKRI